MKVIIAAGDGTHAGRVREELLRTDNALRCELLPCGESVPPCALYVLVDGGDQGEAGAPSPAAGAVRWHIIPRQRDDLARPGFDGTLPWPLPRARLASELRAARRQVRAALASPQPSRRTVLDHIGDLGEALDTGLHNAQRAADLIADFKKIAVDQASEVIRKVELVSYLRSVVASLTPALRRAKIEVGVTGPPVEIMTRPGAVAQVITNLLQNALMHAFGPQHADRHVDLVCDPQGECIALCVADNGADMSPEVAARAFEPFYTTRMGAGGSGLGITIVHNLVVEALRGSIALRTSHGAGLMVRITLPRHPAPQSGRAMPAEAAHAAPAD